MAALAAIGTLLATPARAGDAQEAEKLRRLDIMLMVARRILPPSRPRTWPS